MKNLRLVFDDENDTRKDVTLPMEKWISDWWYECNIVPSNDTVILVAEVDGKSVLDDIKVNDERNIDFEEVAWHFNWDGLYDDFIGDVERTGIRNDSTTFEKWLLENVE